MVGRRALLTSAGVCGFSPVLAKAELLPRGAFADGTSHPLSARYRTLAEAQAVYPGARNLTDETDWCALQGAIDAAAAQGGGAVVIDNVAHHYVLNRPLTINPNLVTVSGGGATLDFRSLKSHQAGILFKADGAPSYGHERHAFEGFELVGPGRDTRVAGMVFETVTETLSSRAGIRDCAIHGFTTGILFSHRAYAIGFSHCSVYDCGTCVRAPARLQDAGESISFSQSYLFNSESLVANPGAFDLRLVACSLDYARLLITDNTGIIDLVGCRLEMAPPVEAPIRCGGSGRVNMFGGFFLINGDRGTVLTDELFALEHPASSINLFAVSGWNWRTKSGLLTRGPGKVFWHQGSEINEPPASVRHP